MRFSRACLVALLLAFSVMLGCATAHAANLDEALAHFTADDFSETITGIEEVAASGSPRAETIIRALQDGRLMFSAERKAVYIKDDSDKLTDAATGQPIAGDAPADADTVRINNRLRGAIDAALGALTLLASNPAARFEAAQAVFKSRDESALPALETAIAKEQDPRIKKALMEAQAAVILASADAKEEDKLAAVDVIRQRGDQDALGLLSSLPADTPAPVMKAAAAAIGAIQNRLAVWNTVQNAWYGLSLGSVLLLAAIGLAITFGVMGVINMAHGEMVMIGAYVTFVVQEVIRATKSGVVRLFAGHRHSAVFPRRRLRRHPGRTLHHPLPLRKAARDVARDLGAFADPATGGAHDVRPEQSRCRQSLLDEWRVRFWRHHDHL